MKIFDRDIAGVLFDMDGLMLDTERLSLRAWQAGCAEVGVTLTRAQFLDILGHREADCLRLVKGMHGEHLDAELIARATRRHYARLIEECGVPVMPGVPEVLRLLKAAGLPLAVATSTHHEVALKKLSQAGLAHYFREIVGGDMVRHGKPAPDLYLRAADAIGVAPERCLALEDSGPGLRAAHAAGCATVLIPDLKPPTPEVRALAWRVPDSMREFSESLRVDLWLGDCCCRRASGLNARTEWPQGDAKLAKGVERSARPPECGHRGGGSGVRLAFNPDFAVQGTEEREARQDYAKSGRGTRTKWGECAQRALPDTFSLFASFCWPALFGFNGVPVKTDSPNRSRQHFHPKSGG